VENEGQKKKKRENFVTVVKPLDTVITATAVGDPGRPGEAAGVAIPVLDLHSSNSVDLDHLERGSRLWHLDSPIRSHHRRLELRYWLKPPGKDPGVRKGAGKQRRQAEDEEEVEDDGNGGRHDTPIRNPVEKQKPS